MRTLRFVLLGLAAVLAMVSTLHLTLGLGADQLLGVGIDDAVVRDPGLASQNRFFGTAYGLYAVVVWLASRDLDRHRAVLSWALVLTMLGGLSRLIPWSLYGPPPRMVMVLFATEILIPPVLLLWMARITRSPRSVT